jgi:hypothetical protein
MGPIHMSLLRRWEGVGGLIQALGPLVGPACSGLRACSGLACYGIGRNGPANPLTWACL